jgi:hypothetical protein
MKRVDGFGNGEKSDDGWVVVKVRVRPEWVEALQAEAQRESQQLNRRVYLTDLLRDALRGFMVIRRILPATKPKFRPSDKSELP